MRTQSTDHIVVRTCRVGSHLCKLSSPGSNRDITRHTWCPSPWPQDYWSRAPDKLGSSKKLSRGKGRSDGWNCTETGLVCQEGTSRSIDNLSAVLWKNWSRQGWARAHLTRAAQLCTFLILYKPQSHSRVLKMDSGRGAGALGRVVLFPIWPY